ncbi:MAG TPA: VOC family protein [Tetragenococcus sp.]|nr:VOC family protein [Tetragenococcus sp.]
MFSNKIQIPLFVENVQQTVEFWQMLDFVVLDEKEMDGTTIAEIAPDENAALHLIIYDRNFVEEQTPEVDTMPPQIMFFSQEIIDLYQKMQSLPIQLGELLQMEEGLIFNFVDSDGNYFVVSEE